MIKIEKRFHLFILLGLFLIVNSLIFSCANGRGLRQSAHADGRHGFRGRAMENTIRGLASYYGKKFHGRTTANGEVFNMYAYTAAHKSLAFGTMLEVTNLSNGKKVVVRINDRGPFVRNRILDLSYAAAKEIGMLRSGTAEIEARIISRAK
ncbi:MAG TPA: septal ring lytic transglycosylase RlpA family protein [Caldithrix abyssi]|uniref:Probable endolytic peptidoglycan transglycosylase RlpA n=1 Tax=Caldithrix abyssi TaxID=187145 RepID=A0A7V5RQD5_CALAY|nr:septal ring lytic transglycosylase RlpA family protein [Caldithrix abyssi]